MAVGNAYDFDGLLAFGLPTQRLLFMGTPAARRNEPLEICQMKR